MYLLLKNPYANRLQPLQSVPGQPGRFDPPPPGKGHKLSTVSLLARIGLALLCMLLLLLGSLWWYYQATIAGR